VGRRRAERQIVIEASQQECFDTLVDYESFPDWQRGIAEVQVLTRHRDGRGKEVTFGVGAPRGTRRYTLDYSYEAPYHVSWRCADLGRDEIAGEVVLENRPDGTTLATCSLALDGAEEAVDVALEDLKARVEA
jgi:uncharacterized membrane protein